MEFQPIVENILKHLKASIVYLVWERQYTPLASQSFIENPKELKGVFQHQQMAERWVYSQMLVQILNKELPHIHRMIGRECYYTPYNEIVDRILRHHHLDINNLEVLITTVEAWSIDQKQEFVKTWIQQLECTSPYKIEEWSVN